MKYLFFDTETTGLPKNYKAPHTDTANWPRVVQLSWLIATDSGEIIKENDFIIKVNFPIPEQASNVHGITNEVSLAKGVELRTVLEKFLADVAQADKLIGHNVSFDMPIVQCELVRCGLQSKITLPAFCTMKNTTNYCQIPGPYGYKWPKLEELYLKCFNKKLLNAHNAMADVKATYEVFYHLKNQQVF
ncbi:MAG: hypothetical protein BroJett040_05490 [Oligoflexia bacterium]|nr:MAG: hypothetical protein BroJett040_05490 [Oligoflexia bacterium]